MKDRNGIDMRLTEYHDLRSYWEPLSSRSGSSASISDCGSAQVDTMSEPRAAPTKACYLQHMDARSSRFSPYAGFPQRRSPFALSKSLAKLHLSDALDSTYVFGRLVGLQCACKCISLAATLGGHESAQPSTCHCKELSRGFASSTAVLRSYIPRGGGQPYRRPLLQLSSGA
ncbi:hypothetical protein OH76DRAFT_1395140 [Lentinus brumalis]|uniref:Uncharacterized protein n=1 Tax=Lentinus brumalis TaxID=2498619 RepID=A0A371DXS4_9APHY|nr:hypothetical protein OH76DRAFT_1395140 [Polyporus brumalis]